MKMVLATGIYPPEIGGPAGYVRGLAAELVSRGHQVAVVAYGTDKTEMGRGFEVTVILRTYGPLVRYCRYMLAVRRLARKSDLVYIQGPVSEGLPGMLGAILANKPTVLKIVGDYAWEQYQQTSVKNPELLDEFLTHRHSGKVRLFEAIERWVAKKAKVIIVPSKYLKTVVEKWGIPSNKIKVVYNSIPPLPSVVDDQLRVKHQLEDKKVILTVVRAVPWKGGDFLCDCLKELPIDYVLAVIGDGPSLEQWKQHAERISVADRVIWLGRLSRAEVANWYRAANVFVLATGYEGFPHVVVEACSVGLQCIVSDRGGNPETKEFFPDLVTVAPYQNKQAWVREIEARFSNRDSRFSAADIRASGVLSFERMVNQTLEILKTGV
ncbi:MAG: glycosyltransferase family 4 protein [Patescibacteria group bacterium]|nr:glycosyltransferase family 4 protein [Patescibacteria group bacterium]